MSAGYGVSAVKKVSVVTEVNAVTVLVSPVNAVYIWSVCSEESVGSDGSECGVPVNAV